MNQIMHLFQGFSRAVIEPRHLLFSILNRWIIYVVKY